MTNDSASTQSAQDFAEAGRRKPPGLLRDFWDFLRENRKWWLIPLILAIAGVGLLVAIAGSSAAPFLYPLF